MARRWRRRLFRGGMVAAALGVVALMTLPYWWPAIVGRLPGISIGGKETSGWSTVELRDVTYEREGLRVTLDSVRVPAFGLWPKAESGPMVVAGKAVVAPQPVVRPDGPPPSARRIVADVLRTWPQIQRWVPSAQVDEVEIVPASGGEPLRLTGVDWDGARLAARMVLPGRTESITVSVSRPDEQTLQAAASTEEPTAVSLEARARVLEQELSLEGGVTWRENHAKVTAVFGVDGLVPRAATVEAPALVFAAADLGLTGYGPIRGSLQGEWTGESYALTVAAAAAPVESQANLPPLAVDLQATGNLEEIRVESALVHVPGVDATLSSPLVFALPSGAPSAPADFALEVDLAQVPQAPAEGRLTGRIHVTAGPGVAAPAVGFSLDGDGIRWREGEIPVLHVAGRWTTGELLVEQVDVHLGDDSRIQASGTLNLNDRSIAAARASARVSAAALRPWVPAVPEFAVLTGEAQAEGPWAAPNHTGKGQWEGYAGVPGGAIAGDLSWQGEGIATVAIEGSLTSEGGVTLPLALTAGRATDGALQVELAKLAWQDAKGEWWKLARPASFRMGPDGFAVDGLELAGEADAFSLVVDADVQWPAAGRLTVRAANMAAERLAFLLPPAAGAAFLESMDVQATWNDGPVQLDGGLRAHYAAAQAADYAIEAEFRTEDAELAIGAVRVYDDTGTVLEGMGRVPLRMGGSGAGFRVELPRDGELALRLDSTPNAAFWASVSELTGWQIAAPELQVHLAGTLAAPQGRVHFGAESLQPPAGFANTVQLPRIGDVNIVVVADSDGLTLTRGILTIDYHWVSLNGRAPWSIWQTAREGAGVPWREAEFAFAADRMPLSIASRAMPRLLAPDGFLYFELKHEPRQGLAGSLWLEDVALRPIQPLGALRDIEGKMVIEGNALTLERLSAQLGGQPINITGDATVENLDHPVFNMHLVSSRVPLVRQEGLVLRAALDLEVAQTADKPAHISGEVNLARSVFVSDLVGLLPTGGSVAAPEQRPPFFSVPQEPFGAWTLDVRLQGEDFLQIQNPFFRSEVSADFRLGGTLAEPRAIGRAWSDAGTIIFPFGSLALQQAEVALTPEQPFALALHAQAATRIYGYNVRLEVSGTAHDPRLLFNSDPPLTSQQLFLMLSAGELPSEEHAFTTSERAQRLAMFVGRNLASTLGIGGGGAGGDRLIVRSGEDFSREGGETIYVQYNIDDRWSIVGEKDRFDAYNGGIKFRLIDR